MSGLTHDSSSQHNIFGKRAIMSTSPSVAGQQRIYQRTNSSRGFQGIQNFVSPANSDLAGVAGTEDMIIDLFVKQQ